MGYRRRRALHRRYGRSFSGGSAITRPRADGQCDVIVVDGHGNVRETLARGVPYSLARSIIRRRHR